MKYGHVRDFFPRVVYKIIGPGGSLNIEFIVDTGFDGQLSLPPRLLEQLNAPFLVERTIALADGSRKRRPYYELEIE